VRSGFTATASTITAALFWTPRLRKAVPQGPLSLIIP
jgi:hypothetical protein